MHTKRYSVRVEENRRTGPVVHLEDTEAGVAISCAPKFGFIWSSFTVTPPGKDAPVELFYRAKFPPKDLDDGMCPVLFPLVGRLRRGNREGVYRRGGREWLMPMHGFARDLPWELIEANASRDGAFVTARLADSAKTKKSYNWSFAFQMTYRLANGVVDVIPYVNCDGPWTLGFHPFFRLPLGDDPDTRDRCLLRVPVDRTWEEKHLVPTGKILPIPKSFPLAKGVPMSKVHCDAIFTDIADHVDGRYTMEYYDPAARVGVAIEPCAKIFSEVVIYCQKHEPFVCIEPWTAPPNAFNTGWGLASAGTAMRSIITYRPIFTMPKGIKG